MTKASSGGGIYTLPDVASLLGVPQQRIRGWISGSLATEGKPIIANGVDRIGTDIVFSFAGLIEARFVMHLNDRGVRLCSLIVIAEAARQRLQDDHPFATRAIFKDEGQRVLEQSHDQTEDPKLEELIRKNWALFGVFKQDFLQGLSYDRFGRACRWRPSVHSAPGVVLDPNVSFGQPTLADSGVPTAVLYEVFMSDEDESLESVGRSFNVSQGLVLEAIRFEARLMRML